MIKIYIFGDLKYSFRDCDITLDENGYLSNITYFNDVLYKINYSPDGQLLDYADPYGNWWSIDVFQGDFPYSENFHMLELIDVRKSPMTPFDDAHFIQMSMSRDLIEDEMCKMKAEYVNDYGYVNANIIIVKDNAIFTRDRLVLSLLFEPVDRKLSPTIITHFHIDRPKYGWFDDK